MAASSSTRMRRSVSYESFDQLLADAQACAARNAQTTGAWTLGQIFEHLATALDKSLDGFGFSVPWPVRLVARHLFRARILRDGMSAGIRLKGDAARALLPGETVTSAQGLAHLERAVARTRSAPTRAVHPFFGPLSREESDRIQLRHAELHMSFVEGPRTANAGAATGTAGN